MLPTDPCAPECCGTTKPTFPDIEPVDRPGGPKPSYVRPLVRMAGMAQDIPDFAYIGWQWIQPVPISYDVQNKILNIGCNFVRVPQIVRTAINHANRLPRSDEAASYAFHVDTTCDPATLYTSDGTQWHRIGGSAC